MKRKKDLIKTLVLAFMMLWGICHTEMPVEAATATQKAAFRAELTEMFYSADASTHNVSSYGLTVPEVLEIYDDMKENECRLIMESYYSNMAISYTYGLKTNIVKSLYIMNVDSDVLPRYERLKSNVEEILAGIEDDMTDLDKVIYLHDAVVDLVRYQYVAYQSYGACGALGDEVAVCAGYAKAYNMLLDMQGIDTDYVKGDGINHGWTYVELDGKWYHIDPTWDDTRSAVQGVASHQFLLRNDKEFLAGGSNSHVGWYPRTVTEDSTSTRFSNWYVHDITGKMSFEGGYWYYVDTINNDILCADALGKEHFLVLDGAQLGTLTLVDVEDGMITYKVGNVTIKESLDEVGKDIVVEIPEVDKTPEINQGTSSGKVEISGSVEISTFDFNNINNWKEGRYSATSGLFGEASGYICTKDLVLCDSLTTYEVTMKDARFHGVVNEYTEKGRFIRSTDVVNGDELVTSADCAYIGVSIYFPNWKTINFAEYTTKFTYNLMTFELTQVGQVEDIPVEDDTEDDVVSDGVVSVESIGKISEADFNDINLWQEGQYNATTGLFGEAAGYICTKALVACDSLTTYKVSMKDARFHGVVNEYTESGSFVRSTDVVDGDELVTDADSAYIGVSIYFPNWKSISFAEYAKKLTYDLMTFELSEIGQVDNTPVDDSTEEEATPDSVVTVQFLGKLNEMDFNDISLWQEGGYDAESGEFGLLQGYICTKKYVDASEKGIYKIKMKDARFHTVINEYRKNGSLVTSTELVNGDTWIPNAETSYIGVSIFFPNWKTISFSEYTKKMVYDLMSLEINRVR